MYNRGIMSREVGFLKDIHSGFRQRPFVGYMMPPLMENRQYALSEEIRVLRRLMESVAAQDNSFTSASVIEISSRLDRKINEYMQLVHA